MSSQELAEAIDELDNELDFLIFDRGQPNDDSEVQRVRAELSDLVCQYHLAVDIELAAY